MGMPFCNAAGVGISVILAPDLGQHLPVEVEAALAARGGDQREVVATEIIRHAKQSQE
jgi:hypothetical protein